ncbi:4-hydroxybenzoate octaprenyltransferase [uncultured Thiothrix sp.]|jgi:4-hydroxybenzoate polyprenyltransferase|uniref:4-hydroxybenzoate octaprenyltransferase n=1 Tax=uncultured Thiothrix sp. TaxID=223185 RepID=UPI00263354F2|nr:4-hydroxybenzoate octaprenyltransferase [uncultured Thiothrix sp.]HMT92151.1 4-hydroxybenzoate octaprenyltransferase [Thiolinea sp.]
MQTERLKHYGRLIRFDRPIGSLLLLWPTYWALWIAEQGFPGWKLVIIFSLGTFLMRSAGCAINDIADRKVDGYVERTKLRPLATGAVSVQEALGVFGGLVFLAFLLVLQLNALTIGFSLIAVLLAASYPFMKRYHHWPQVYLGVAFAWGIPMAFTTIQNQFPPLVAWVLLLANVAWTTAYDTMYAMCDREDDLKIGVKSTAIIFGEHDRLIVGVLQVATLVLLLWAGLLADLDLWFWLSLVVAAGFFVYQQYLIRNRDRWLSLRAFLNNNWVGLILFIGIVLSYSVA